MFDLWCPIGFTEALRRGRARGSSSEGRVHLRAAASSGARDAPAQPLQREQADITAAVTSSGFFFFFSFLSLISSSTLKPKLDLH